MARSITERSHAARTTAALIAVAVALACAGLGGSATASQINAAGHGAVTSWATFGHDLANTRHAQEFLVGPGNAGRLKENWSAPGAAVTSTPAVVDEVVYYSDFAGNLTARGADGGSLLWQTNLAPAQSPGSPAVTRDTVYTAGAGGMVYAVDRVTGAKKWGADIELTPNALIWSSPVVADNTLIIGSGSFQVFSPASPPFQGSVVGLDATTGSLKWRTPVCTGDCTGVSVWSSAAVDTDLKMAYIGTGQAYELPAGDKSDALVALSYETGQIVWHHQYTKDDTFGPANPDGKDWDLGAAPNLFRVNGRLLVGCGDKGGHYKVFDAKTGTVVWEKQLVAGSQLGGIEETTAYADGTIYAVGNTESTASSRADARPTAATLFAVNAADGRTRWQVDLPDGGFGGVTVANGVLYFTTWDGILRAHSTRDGKTLFAKYVGDPTAAGVVEKGAAGGPSVSNGRVYVGYGWTWGSLSPGGIRSFGVY